MRKDEYLPATRPTSEILDEGSKELEVDKVHYDRSYTALRRKIEDKIRGK